MRPPYKRADVDALQPPTTDDGHPMTFDRATAVPADQTTSEDEEATLAREVDVVFPA